MKFVFTKIGFAVLLLALVVTVISFIMMAKGDITVSPILLISTYVILFPLSILLGVFSKEDKKES